jgi:hypothetical protein
MCMRAPPGCFIPGHAEPNATSRFQLAPIIWRKANVIVLAHLQIVRLIIKKEGQADFFPESSS